MKIGFIIFDYNYHGGSQKTASIAEHLQSLGHSVNIIAIRCRKGDYETRPSHFSNILDLHASGLFSGVFKLAKFFFNYQYDVLICIGSFSNLFAGLAKFLVRSKIPIIGSENFATSVLIGDFPKPWFRLLWPLFRLSYTQLNGLMFVSEKLRQKFLKKNSWHETRCITIYNPVRSLQKKLKQFKDEKNLGITFLGVGVLEKRKRFDLLLKSFSIVANPIDRLLIAGAGSLEHDLKKLAIDLGIESQVFFLGYVNDIDTLMKNSDILILTSNSEAFGMVLAEGLAHGLQVVSTNSFSGPAEVLGNGRYGFLAEVENVSSIVCAIRSAIKSPKSQEIIHEGVSRFSLDSIVNKYIDFSIAVIGSKGNLNEPL